MSGKFGVGKVGLGVGRKDAGAVASDGLYTRESMKAHLPPGSPGDEHVEERERDEMEMNGDRGGLMVVERDNARVGVLAVGTL
jgi:hypothetical protein